MPRQPLRSLRPSAMINYTCRIPQILVPWDITIRLDSEIIPFFASFNGFGDTMMVVYGPVYPPLRIAPTKFFSRRILTRHYLMLGLCLGVVPQAAMVELEFSS